MPRVAHVGGPASEGGFPWLSEVVWDEDYRGPIPELEPVELDPRAHVFPGTRQARDASAARVTRGDAAGDSPSIAGPVVAPVLSRAAMWRRDAVRWRSAVAG